MITFSATPISEDLLGQHVLTVPTFESFRQTTWLPILVTELASVIGQYVLAFRKQDGLFLPTVLTDMGFGRNLYIDRDGRWMSRYLPLCLRHYPFCFVANETKERVLGVARDRLTSEVREGSFLLLGPDGTLSEDAEKYRSGVEKLEVAFQQTLRTTKVLSDEGLIVEWPMKVRLEKEKEPVAVEGLYRIDTERLLSLGGDRLEHLKNHGVLTFALSQPMSMQHTNVLMERAAYLIKHEAQSKKVRPPRVDPNQRSFDLSDDEMISF